MLPFLSSLEEKKCLTLPRLGTAQPSMRDVTLICGPVFWSTSGVDHLPRSHEVPVSTKGVSHEVMGQDAMIFVF